MTQAFCFLLIMFAASLGEVLPSKRCAFLSTNDSVNLSLYIKTNFFVECLRMTGLVG